MIIIKDITVFFANNYTYYRLYKLEVALKIYIFLIYIFLTEHKKFISANLLYIYFYIMKFLRYNK